jgi:organic hydroperoxide reductase OsmC/OhrA
MSARARVFEYDVSIDTEWTARSTRGGAALVQEDEAWTPEHLVLAGLARCTLTSFRYHARRAGLEPVSRATAHGVVTRREEDGRFAFVEITVDIDVELGAAGDSDVPKLVEAGERDCFVGASLTVKPSYRWIVDGAEIA